MKVKISYKISESDTKRIRKKMKETKDANAYRRLEVVALLGEGKAPLEVAEITNFHPKYVRTLGCKFNRNGLESFVDDGRKGGNNRSMSPEGASEFLKQFEEKAKSGQVITVEEISMEFNKQTGKERESLSTIYYFLHSHGWRMVMPRSKHPKKASNEVIEASKKLKLESEN